MLEDYTPNALGIFLAVQKKGSNLIVVEGEQEKQKYEFILQVVVPTKNFRLYTSNSELFLKVMNRYAFDAYLFRKYGEKVSEMTKEEYIKEFDEFIKNYNVMMGNQPIAFDYLLEDKINFEDSEEEEKREDE